MLLLTERISFNKKQKNTSNLNGFMTQSTSKSFSTLKNIGSERLFPHMFHLSLMKMMKKDIFLKEKKNLEDCKLPLNPIKHSLKYQTIKPMISSNKKTKDFTKETRRKGIYKHFKEFNVQY